MPVRRVTTGGIDLAVAEAGAGGAPMLLLHGFTGAKEDFTVPVEEGGDAGAVDLLASAGRHAVAPDQRGHGDSAKPGSPADYTLERYAADAVELVDSLGWERFALLGHSMGGMIAQVLALANPGRVEALVLMDTAHGPLEGVDRSQAALAEQIIREQGMEALAAAMAERRGTSPLETEASRRVLAERPGWGAFSDRKLVASSGVMYVAMLAELFDQPDRLDALGTLTMPTLVLVGEQDTPFRGHSERMAEAIPGARLEVVPDAGHSPQFENPRGWWKALGAFVEEVGG